MKKTIILLLIAFVLFFPPASIYFAIKSSDNLQAGEYQANLETGIFADINELGQSSDESTFLIRRQTKLIGLLQTEKLKYLEDLNNPQLDDYLTQKTNETIDLMAFPCEFEFLIFDNNNRFVRAIHFGKDLGLQTITNSLKNPMEKPELLQPWQVLYRNTLPGILSNNVALIAIREPEQCLSLSGGKINEQLFIFALSDMSNFSSQRSIQMKIKRLPSRNYGVGAIFPDSQTLIYSEFFKTQPTIKALIKDYASRVGPQQLKISASGHDLFFSDYDPFMKCRFFAVAAAVDFSSSRSSGSRLWLVLISLISCILFKLLIEKLALGRGPDVSFKLMIPAVFIFLMIQPFFASAYLASEFFRVSYANEKNHVTSRLAGDLQNIDLATSDATANSLNLARGFNSIERIASYTENTVNTEIADLALQLIIKINKEVGNNQYKSLGLCTKYDQFIGAKTNENNGFELDKNGNMVSDLFKKRFMEILSSGSNNLKASQSMHESKLDSELKGEYARGFFLKIFGSSAFYRFRQNSAMRIEVIAKYRHEHIFTNPVSFKNEPYAYLAWVAVLNNSRLFVSDESLSFTDFAPRIALLGNDNAISSVGFKGKNMAESHPELARIAESAHISQSKTASLVETADTTMISMAVPAQNSNFTFAGSELMRSYTVFRNYMEKRITLIAIATFVTGALLAFAGALYFVWPLRELTVATQEVFMGNFSVRIHEDHPDEFAALGKSFNNMANRLEEGVLLKSFVTDSVLREVAGAEDSSLAEKAETTVASIVFAALCGFSEFQKNLGAQEVFSRLQYLLQAADSATQTFGGEIDKMIEDKVMIVFEHRGPDADSMPERAIKAAAFICERVFSETGMVVAAGVNTGVTIAGIMGAEKARLSRTVVGDPVNLAARLASEALKIDGGIVISGQLVAAVPQGFRVEKLPISKVKGKTQSIEAFKVLK